jgi:hypothetical protein
VVNATVCDDNGSCRKERLPVDADNEVHCQLVAGLMRVTQWLQEHPSLHLKSVDRCAAASERDL